MDSEREDYNGVLIWFSENQLPPSIVNYIKNNLNKKEISLKQEQKESRTNTTSF